VKDEHDAGFWKGLARAVMVRRGPQGWLKQRTAVFARIHPERPHGRRFLIWTAVPAAAALAVAVWISRRPADAPREPLIAKTPQEIPAPPAATPPEAARDAAPDAEGEEESSSWDARITAVEGKVLLTNAAGEASFAQADAPLQAGDRLDVSSSGRVEIALASDSVMEFSAGSRVTVGSIEKKDSLIDLAVGTVVAKLNWAKRRGYGMRIRSPVAVAAVRGTEFAVQVAENGETDIGVFDEGRVAVTDRADEKSPERMLAPRQEIRFERGARRAPPEIRELRRLRGHRDRVAHMNGRQAFLKENWRRMPARERSQARRRAFERGMRDPATRERMQRRMQKRREEFATPKSPTREMRRPRQDGTRPKEQKRRSPEQRRPENRTPERRPDRRNPGARQPRQGPSRAPTQNRRRPQNQRRGSPRGGGRRR